MLVAAGFDREITTTVLWLNDVYGLDVRCVRLTPYKVAQAFTSAYPGSRKRLGRWFIEAPLHDDGKTWVPSKMWGTNTEPVLDRLLALAPTDGYAYAYAYGAASDS